MAQKAAKQVARRNAEKLSQLHVISLALHTFFILYRLLFHFRSVTFSVVAKYLLFTLPSLFIEFYFEKLGRPKYSATGDHLRKAGEDLDAAGMIEYMWDVTYVTWACLFVVPIFGEWAWWLWAVIPLFGGYTVFSTVAGARKAFSGAGADQDQDSGSGGTSKRQQKMEKRGQRIRHG